MNCPECDIQLKTIDFNSKNKAYKFNIAYCSSCGGFWLDSFTVNNLTVEDVRMFDNLIKNRRQTTKNLLLCPRCQLALKSLEGESIPRQIAILSCDQCGGRWFPAGELLKFKQAQSAKLNYLKTWNIPLKSTFSVLLPLAFIFLFGLSLPIFYTFFKNYKLLKPRQIAPQQFFQQPESNLQSATEIEISFTTEKEAITFIEYGLSKNDLKKEYISTKPTTKHTIILSNLIPNREYYYRLGAEYENKIQNTPFYTFVGY